MAKNLFQRAWGGGGASTLQADLKRATDSGVIEIPQELFGSVVSASHCDEDRRTIMGHVRECLCEPSGRRWRRVYAGLVLMEHLCKNGAPELLTETAEGLHFDLVQRLSLLEHFECTNDKRVQNMVRQKATALRADLIGWMQSACDSQSVIRTSAGEKDKDKDTLSTCSPGLMSAVSGSTYAQEYSKEFAASDKQTSISCEDNPVFKRPEGPQLINGMVCVGHKDDTTSDSEDEGRASRKRHEGSTRPPAARRRSSSSSDEDRPVARRQPPAAAPAPSADLLEL